MLANDTDTDGGPKAIASTTEPAHGEVAVSAPGDSLTYRPDPDYCGADSFTYTLNGGSTADGLDHRRLSRSRHGHRRSDDQPGPQPDFDSSVDDYYVRCGEEPVQVAAEVAQGYSLSVDGQAPATGRRSVGAVAGGAGI